MNRWGFIHKNQAEKRIDFNELIWRPKKTGLLKETGQRLFMITPFKII